MRPDIETTLWHYLRENCLPRNIEIEYGNDDNLFDRGIIDSAGLLAFVSYVEQEFGLVIPDEDLLPENFSSIASISDYIRQRTQILPR